MNFYVFAFYLVFAISAKYLAHQDMSPGELQSMIAGSVVLGVVLAVMTPMDATTGTVLLLALVLGELVVEKAVGVMIDKYRIWAWSKGKGIAWDGGPSEVEWNDSEK